MKTHADHMNRRSFLESTLAVAATASVGRVALAGENNAAATSPRTEMSLREKFFGCIAGCHIGSAMGAPVEGWPWERIEREYGLLDRLLPYSHYGRKDWVREPGTTEDGVERQKLIITAILEKGDRITAEDLRRAWVDHMNPNAAGLISEPFEGALLAMAKTHIPASDIGKYCDYSGLVSLARSCHPIGLINAGDIRGAIDDVREIGQLYNTANSRGILWAEVTVIAIAAATTQGATVDRVLGAVFDNCDKVDSRFMRSAGIRAELERALKLTEGCADVREMRRKFDSMYSGTGMVYAQSYANEIVTKALCVLKMTRGNTWEAVKAGVNMGRDTDCLAAVAGGIAGALSGAASVPNEIIAQVDHATSVNPHTSSKRTLRETSDGLYEAFKKRLRRLREYAGVMDIP
ncbi:MAG TPA: ADP-ribosylglycohydrolase family protein [Verrucomicrobiota bacterium]|nr:ADP-ribosylglycohydrolase family protein [Verrucomicrobiota bacterium]